MNPYILAQLDNIRRAAERGKQQAETDGTNPDVYIHILDLVETIYYRKINE